MGVLLSAVRAFTLPSMYSSSTSLMPPESPSASSGLLGLLSMSAGGGAAAAAGSSLLGVKTPGALFIAILGSRTVLDAMVQRFGLQGYYRSRMPDDAAAILAQNSHFSEDPKNGILHIGVDDRNPELAAKMTAAYVEELNTVVITENTSSARRERQFLESRLKEIKRDLDSSSQALSQFSSKTHAIDVPSEGKALVDASLKLEAELAAARSELAGLQQIYSSENVRVKSASARVSELEGELNRITGFSGSSSSSSSASGASGGSYPTLGALPTLGVTYADLQRRVLVEEALWEALTKQYEAAKVQEAKEIPTVRVLDPANVPLRKAYPIRRNIVVLGAVLSLFFACALVAVSSMFEGLDPADERMLLLRDIGGSAARTFRWIPGVKRLADSSGKA